VVLTVAVTPQTKRWAQVALGVGWLVIAVWTMLVGRLWLGIAMFLFGVAYLVVAARPAPPS
jgi:hypothetical protein